MRTVEKTRGTSRWHAISVVCFLPTKKQREARLLKITTGHATIRLKGASDVWRVAGGGGEIRGGRGFAIIYNEETFGTAGNRFVNCAR